MNTLELDEKLILRMAEGDNDAFRDLYEQTSSAVYGFALSILRNVHDAENVMHDAYIRIHRSAAAYQPKGKPMAWILTIVRTFEDRQIVILHALTGMKHREIAELLDLPTGTVTSKYKRSLAKMRKEIEGKGEE